MQLLTCGILPTFSDSRYWPYCNARNKLAKMPRHSYCQKKSDLDQTFRKFVQTKTAVKNMKKPKNQQNKKYLPGYYVQPKPKMSGHGSLVWRTSDVRLLFLALVLHTIMYVS